MHNPPLLKIVLRMDEANVKYMDEPSVKYIDTLSDHQIKNTVDAIWTEVIAGYFLSDIENLEQVTLQPGKNVGLVAVGQFLSVASMLEFLGKTLYNKGDLAYNQRQDKAWQHYFDNYLPFEIRSLCKPIQDLVRHGSAHLFLPREVGLSKRPGEPLFFYENGFTIFNVTTFTDLFKESLLSVKKDLDEKPEITKHFLKRYEEVRLRNLDIYTNVKSDFNATIRNYINSLPPKEEISTCSPVLSIDIIPENTDTPQTTVRPAAIQGQPYIDWASTLPAHPIPDLGGAPPTSPS